MFTSKRNTPGPTGASPGGHTAQVQNKSEQVGYPEFRAILETVKADALLTRLKEYRFTGKQYAGRKTYSIETMWAAFLLLYWMNLPSINELIRRLQDSLELQAICGFDGGLPHRTTFNRSFVRMANHLDLLEAASTQVLGQLKEHLEGFGEEVSVDSTTVITNANPHPRKKRPLSDPEAGWTAKNSARAKYGGKEWHYGYKFHAAADANWNIPIYGYTTPANFNDMQHILPLADKLRINFQKPEVVIADRGYDSLKNHTGLITRGITPIIHIRRNRGRRYAKEYNFAGVPYCECGQLMEHVDTVEGFGDYFVCTSIEKGKNHIEDWYPIDRNYRLRGPIRRDTDEWADLYDKRQSIERVFKSMKQSLRLNTHYHRSLRKVSLHCILSMLIFQVSALVSAIAGELDNLCWMTREIA